MLGHLRRRPGPGTDRDIPAVGGHRPGGGEKARRGLTVSATFLLEIDWRHARLWSQGTEKIVGLARRLRSPVAQRKNLEHYFRHRFGHILAGNPLARTRATREHELPG